MMMPVRTWWLFPLLLAACTPTGTRTPLPPTPPALPNTVVKYERVALFMEGNSARVRGFDGAAPQGVTIQVVGVESGASLATLTADARGRFDATFAAQDGLEVELRPSQGEVLRFKARNRDEAQTGMLRGRLVGTGSTPNQLVLDANAPPTGKTNVLVVLSGDNSIQAVDFDDGHPWALLTAFDDRQDARGLLSATPWNATLEGTSAYVTRYGQGGVSHVNLQQGLVDSLSDPFMPVVLGQTLQFAPPIDADGNGTTETQAGALVPRSPSGLAHVGNQVFVAFANVVSTDSDGRAQFAPGMLGAFNVDGDGRFTQPPQVVLTHFVNPQVVMPLQGGRVLAVVSPGGLQRRNGSWSVEAPGGVELFDASSLASIAVLDLGDFAAARPMLLADGVTAYVPSLLKARVARINLATATVEKGPGAAVGAIELDSSNDLRTIFECALHPTGLALCALFDADALVAVDTVDDAVRPWPFTGNLVLRDAGTTARVGLQSMVVRPGRNGVDRTGNDVLVLQSLSSRVVALDTRFLLGP